MFSNNTAELHTTEREMETLFSLSLKTSAGIELEQNDVPILDNIVPALLSVFASCLQQTFSHKTPTFSQSVHSP